MSDQETQFTFRIDQLAKALNVSRITIHRLDASGRLPKPSRLGRVVIWPADEIRAWLAAGSPPRDRWEAMKTAKGGKR